MANRLLYIDNLRVFCIIIVVFIHSAVTYSGVGSWYYVEPSVIPDSEKLFFFLYQSHAQAFSMSLFFFIAGYFIPDSLRRKGTKVFITNRLYRLGIPVLIYMFLIHPICVKLAYPEVNPVDYLVKGITTLEILSWSGPLWFALTLLIFSVLYAFIHPYLPKADSHFRMSAGKLVFLIALITSLAFGIRIVAPIGTSFMNLQFCFFVAYIVMFYLGIRAADNSMLENITYVDGKRWMWIAFCVGLPIWFATLFTGRIFEGDFLIFGGVNLGAFHYAFWESFFCVMFILALFGISKVKFNTQNRFMKFLSDNVFGIYVFHAPVLIALTVWVKGVSMDVLLKFLIVGIVAAIASLLVAWLIRKIPVFGRFFN